MVNTYRVCTYYLYQESSLFLLRWYDTLFPRIPVPIQKDIMEKLRAHGLYKDDHYNEYSRYVRWKVSKNVILCIDLIHLN